MSTWSHSNAGPDSSSPSLFDYGWGLKNVCLSDRGTNALVAKGRNARLDRRVPASRLSYAQATCTHRYGIVDRHHHPYCCWPTRSSRRRRDRATFILQLHS